VLPGQKIIPKPQLQFLTYLFEEIKLER